MKLSIVTITYNDYEGLQKTLDSISTIAGLNQHNWEHIIIDSTNTNIGLDVLKKYANVNYFKLPPQGIYNALNEGIKKATGDYIWFLNGGDILISMTAYEQAMNAIVQNQNYCLYTFGVSLFENNKKLYNQIPKESFIRNILGANFLCHQGVIYKKSLFNEVGFFNESYKYAADYEHFWQCYLKSVSVKNFKNIILAGFDTSGSSSQYKDVLKEFKTIHKKLNQQRSLVINIINTLAFAFYYFKIYLFKLVRRSVIGAPLRSLWHKL